MGIHGKKNVSLEYPLRSRVPERRGVEKGR